MASASSFPQSAPLTYTLAALGGVLEVFATALLAVPDAKEKQGIPITQMQKKCALVGNVVLQLLASLAGNLFATWFGPVSLVGPIFFSAQLVANMVVFGFLLGLENLTTEMEVGTYVIVVSTIMLPIVGPSLQDGQDAQYLMTQVYAIIWSLILIGGMLGSAFFIFIVKISRYGEWTRMIILLIARSTCFTLNLTASRVFILKPGTVLIVLSTIIKVVSGAIYTWAIVVQSTEVVQSKFVPLNATTLMFVNAVTGVIIWEDWRVVGSWTGYVCVFLLLALASYLLLTGVPVLSSENPEYGQLAHFRQLGLTRQRGSRSFNMTDLDFGSSDDESSSFSGEEGDEKHHDDNDEFQECSATDENGAAPKDGSVSDKPSEDNVEEGAATLEKDDMEEEKKEEAPSVAEQESDIESNVERPPHEHRWAGLLHRHNPDSPRRPGLERSMSTKDAWKSIYHIQ